MRPAGRPDPPPRPHPPLRGRYLGLFPSLGPAAGPRSQLGARPQALATPSPRPDTSFVLLIALRSTGGELTGRGAHGEGS